MAPVSRLNERRGPHAYQRNNVVQQKKSRKAKIVSAMKCKAVVTYHPRREIDRPGATLTVKREVKKVSVMPVEMEPTNKVVSFSMAAAGAATGAGMGAGYPFDGGNEPIGGP